ncbi:fructose PTS transporter subunit IIA [Clostridiaceae bacterium M8S5]|nr:fructose PTS transporter subunit IIA [Clostridiaceae bacterium M8S5]
MDYITTVDLIDLKLESKTKEEAIKKLVEKIDDSGRLKDKNEYLKEVLKREELFTTGIGFGISIPHGKSDAVKIPTLAIGRCEEGIDWQSMDGEAVKTIFLIAVPEESASNQHLKILAALSRRLMNEEYRNKLLDATDSKDILILLEDIINEIQVM